MVNRQVVFVVLAALSVAAVLIALQLTRAGGPPVVQARPVGQGPVVVETVGPATVAASASVAYIIQADAVADLAAARLTFTYDQTLFSVHSVVPGSDFIANCLNEFNDLTPGSLILAQICAPQGRTGAPLKLWVVTLTAAQMAQPQATQFSVTVDTMGDINEDAIPATSSTHAVTILPPGAVVSGVATLQFRPGGDFSIVTVDITCPAFNGSTTADVAGNWRFDGVSGPCSLKADAPGFLFNVLSGVVVGVNVPPTVLLGGDVILDDEFVNIVDITTVVFHFAQATVDCQVPGFPARWVDLNCNGFVNIADVTATVSNFGKGSPQAW